MRLGVYISGNAYETPGDRNERVIVSSTIHCASTVYKREELQAIGNLGRIFCHMDRYEEAIEHYSQAAAMAHETGDKLFEGRSVGQFALFTI